MSAKVWGQGPSYRNTNAGVRMVDTHVDNFRGRCPPNPRREMHCAGRAACICIANKLLQVRKGSSTEISCALIVGLFRRHQSRNVSLYVHLSAGHFQMVIGLASILVSSPGVITGWPWIESVPLWVMRR